MLQTSFISTVHMMANRFPTIQISLYSIYLCCCFNGIRCSWIIKGYDYKYSPNSTCIDVNTYQSYCPTVGLVRQRHVRLIRILSLRSKVFSERNTCKTKIRVIPSNQAFREFCVVQHFPPCSRSNRMQFSGKCKYCFYPFVI